MKEDNDKNNKELKEFAEKNGFDGCFRTSVKNGKNINETLDFLMGNIIKRMETMELNGEKVFEKRKESVSLDVDKDSEIDLGIKDKNIPKKEESKDNNKKCSFKEHKDKEATDYCYNCKVYLCNKCVDYHKELLKNHQIAELDELSKEIFTGLCKEENHNLKLEHYCKNHNILCCGLCICKIKGNGNGQHNECDICLIKDIKEDKKVN